MASTRKRCPELFQFLAGYLHQDFDLDYPNAEAAVAAAIQDRSPQELRVVAAQLADLLASVAGSEPAAEQAVRELCDYFPPSDGHTHVDWLIDIEERVRGSA